jgi:hypothetical protein
LSHKYLRPRVVGFDSRRLHSLREPAPSRRHALAMPLSTHILPRTCQDVPGARVREQIPTVLRRIAAPRTG